METIEAAMREYATRTGGCISFRPRTDELNFLDIRGDRPGSYSNIVMAGGGQQEINCQSHRIQR